MTKLMTAIALAVAFPAAAYAQAAPAPAPKAEHGHKSMDCKCCKDMMAKGHNGHAMPGSEAGHGSPAPRADQQQHSHK